MVDVAEAEMENSLDPDYVNKMAAAKDNLGQCKCLLEVAPPGLIGSEIKYLSCFIPAAINIKAAIVSEIWTMQDYLEKGTDAKSCCMGKSQL